MNGSVGSRMPKGKTHEKKDSFVPMKKLKMVKNDHAVGLDANIGRYDILKRS
jgi:hypothetical protein